MFNVIVDHLYLSHEPSKYQHTTAAHKMTESLISDKMKCKHYNVGYCRFKEECKFFHPKEECETKGCKLKTVLKDTKDSADMVTHPEESKHVNTTDLQQNQMK